MAAKCLDAEVDVRRSHEPHDMVFELLWMVEKTFEQHADKVHLKFAVSDYDLRIEGL